MTITNDSDPMQNRLNRPGMMATEFQWPLQMVQTLCKISTTDQAWWQLSSNDHYKWFRPYAK